MRYNDREPIYLQIISEIKAQIAFGKLAPGMQLPTIKEQAAIMRVNPNTVARVYALLEQERIITKQKGLGTFVSTSEHLARKLREEIAESVTSRFVDELLRLGLGPAEIIKHLQNFLARTLGGESSL
ncbi:MAG: GntR family transcriptional regulator [Firmicutes bacterium]|nr:GntR family transcriptional regulator [Bacillota bacterium]